MDAALREQSDRLRRLRESYEEWHRLGEAALKRRDFPALADALHAENAIMREQRRVMNGLGD